jgi:microcystin-dependent protein
MSQQYLGELRLVAFGFPPRGWAMCNGQLMAINQNQALFSILGTTYGGNGVQSFGLPNLQGRTPTSMGAGQVIGEVGGTETVTLTSGTVPVHTHIATVIASNANATSPSGNYLAATTGSLAIYNSNNNHVALNPGTVQTLGGNQPHENRQPYLVLNWIIALQGIFPSRN